jgi:hypothetical protein
MSGTGVELRLRQYQSPAGCRVPRGDASRPLFRKGDHVRRVLFSLVLAGLLSMSALGVLAADTTEVVTESDIARQAENTPPTDNWVLYTRNAGNGAFVAGPATPPLGVGSLELTTPSGADKVYVFNYDHVGTQLSAIDALGYATYRTTGSLQQVTAINIEVDVNGAAPGGFTTLVFEPVYNTSQGAVVSGAWQTWDAYVGGNATWWSSNPIPAAPNRSTFVSWNTIVAANPDAVIVGGFGVNQGSGNAGLLAATDTLTIGVSGANTIYDFEPYEVASASGDCKDGGWQNVKRADGTSFKNQGDCIQYVNTDK